MPNRMGFNTSRIPAALPTTCQSDNHGSCGYPGDFAANSGMPYHYTMGNINNSMIVDYNPDARNNSRLNPSTLVLCTLPSSVFSTRKESLISTTVPAYSSDASKETRWRTINDLDSRSIYFDRERISRITFRVELNRLLRCYEKQVFQSPGRFITMGFHKNQARMKTR